MSTVFELMHFSATVEPIIASSKLVKLNLIPGRPIHHWQKSARPSSRLKQGHSKAKHIEALAAKTRSWAVFLICWVTIWESSGHGPLRMQSCKYGHTSTKVCQKVYNSRNFEPWFSHDRSVDLISKTTSAWYKAGKNLVSTAMLPTSAKTPWANQLVTRCIVQRCATVSLSIPPSHNEKITKIWQDWKCWSRLKVFWRLRSQLLKLSAASSRWSSMRSLRPEQRAELL